MVGCCKAVLSIKGTLGGAKPESNMDAAASQGENNGRSWEAAAVQAARGSNRACLTSRSIEAQVHSWGCRPGRPRRRGGGRVQMQQESEKKQGLLARFKDSVRFTA